MSCRDLLPLIEKLADGESTPSERSRAEAHLEACESCREHFRFLVALPQAARQAPLPEPPEMYWDVLPRKVMARIDQRLSGRPLRRLHGWLPGSRLGWVGALAAGVIAVVVGLEVYRSQPGPESRGESGQADSSKGEGREGSPTPMSRPEKETLDRERASSSLTTGAPVEVDIASEPSLQRKPDSPSGDRPREPRVAPPEPEMKARGYERLTREAALSAQEVATVPPKDRAEPVEGPSKQKRQAAAFLQDEAKEENEFALEAASPQPAAPPEVTEEEQEILRAPPTRPTQAPPLEKAAADTILTSGESSGKSAQAAQRTLSIAAPTSEAELEAECRATRTTLVENPNTDQTLDARYRLALCSIRLFKLHPSQERRSQAVRDGTAFLEIFSSGDRADEIRGELNSIQREQR